MENSELPARRRMQNGGGGGGGAAAAVEMNAVPTKRLRRPNVRLNQPYYENPGHRKLQQQWKDFKKDLEGARKPRTLKTVNVKISRKRNGVNDSSNGEEMKDLNFDDDDDVAIGSWKDFNIGKRNRAFKSNSKRKRVGPSSSKRWASVESHENDYQENGNFPSSSGCGIEKRREGKEGEGEEEENLGANGSNRNFEPEDSVPSSPNRSFGNDKLSDDDNNDNNVGGIWGRRQRGLIKGQKSDDMEMEMRTREGESDGNRDDKDSVRVWLNQLGLGKYAPLFEVHEVDDEVLPFLTLEDLKDMGINAIGPRRKMYRSIQKLGKGFS